MVFVRSKQVDGNTYYQLVKNERVEGKHRQRVLMHLGHHCSVEAALEAWKKRARSGRQIAAGLQKRGIGNPYAAVREAEALEEKVARLQELQEQGKA